MSHHPHSPARRPTQLASVVLVWLAALLSFGGLAPLALPDAGPARAAATDAARVGDLPARHSTAPSLQNRLLLVEAAVEGTSGSDYDGRDPVVPVDTALDLSGQNPAQGGPSASSSATATRVAGFLARAPPILA
jgi:hypothetical protein